MSPSPNRPTVLLIVQVDPEVWEAYQDGPLALDRLAAHVKMSMLGVLSNVEAVYPSFDDDPEDAEDWHSYQAHDSGFMMFAVETAGYGTFHTVDPNGKRVAESDPVSSSDDDQSGNVVRKAWHQLVDRTLDAYDAQADNS